MVRSAKVHLILRFWSCIDNHQVFFVLLELGCPDLKDSFCTKFRMNKRPQKTKALLWERTSDARGRRLFLELDQQGRSRRAFEMQCCWEASAKAASSYLRRFPASPPLTASLRWHPVVVPSHSACGKRFLVSQWRRTPGELRRTLQLGFQFDKDAWNETGGKPIRMEALLHTCEWDTL